jgi:hypothetical protein
MNNTLLILLDSQAIKMIFIYAKTSMPAPSLTVLAFMIAVVLIHTNMIK